MSLSSISIKRPVFAWMLMIGLIVFGAIAFTRMGISQLPDVDFPVINIALTLQNAAPEVMESDVVDPVEDAVMGIEGIRTVSSNASQGAANVTVEFELNRNIDVALQEVQTRIAQAAKRLPNKLDPPVITKTNPEDQPILWLMLTSDGTMPLYQQMIYARNTLKDRFSTVSGVGDVLLGGYVDPNLRVNVSTQALTDYELTADDILTAIQGEQLEEPAGRIENPKKEFNVRLLGEAASPIDFGKILINSRGGSPNSQPLRLDQISSIEEGLSDIREISRYNGKSAVGLGIVKQRGSNAVEVSRLVGERVQQIRSSLPKGLSLDVRLDTTRFIKDSVAELNITLLLAALLTSIVCFLFLGSWSSTINVLLAIPTSIVGTFIALYFWGFTLNTFTLLGLSLAIGIVVDDAIMMLENIVRHAERGSDRMKAALEGSEEISFAAIAATIAIAAIFVPVIFMKGVIGRFFYQYGITVTVAVLLSLLEALTLTPMRCSQFLKTFHGDNWIAKTMDRWMEACAITYEKSLRLVLKYKGTVMVGSVLLFVLSLGIAKPLRKELIPEQDQSLFLITLKTPVGSSIYATDEKFKLAEDYLSKQPEVLEYYTTVGSYQGADIVNEGTLFITLTDPKKRSLSQREFMEKSRNELKKLISDTDVYAQDLSLGGFSSGRGYPIEFTIQGADLDQLAKSAKELMAKMKASDLLEDISSDFQEGMPEIQIIPDRDKAAARGVALSTIGTNVGVMVGGSIFTSSTQYPKDGHRYDIRVRSKEGEHNDPKDIEKIKLRNNRGELVPLMQVVSLNVKPALQMISRMNRERAIPIYANVSPGKSQQDALDYVKKTGLEILPPNYHLTFTGSAQTFTESFTSLIFALLLGIAVSYMVLASQFNSFLHPIAILMALPFSVSGAFVALFLTHQSLNLFSLIGLILLMGIVKKNSILLIDFTNQKRAEGLPPTDALLAACPVRLRPILMTSIATIAGAIPAALALGPGAETRVPMAISIIGGVLVSTLLTLFVVPAAYSLMTRLEGKSESEEQPHAAAKTI